MIEITRSYRFDAPQDRVWQLLMDTSALSSCIPGCESLDPDPQTEHLYRIRLSVKLAAVMGTYDGSVQLVDIAPMQSYGLLAEGNGRPGFVRGKAAIALAPDADASATLLTVAGEVQAGGAIDDGSLLQAAESGCRRPRGQRRRTGRGRERYGRNLRLLAAFADVSRLIGGLLGRRVR